MGIEIERKYLVNGAPFETWGAGVKMKQGSLARGKSATTRIRVAGEIGFLTIKGKTEGISRLEFEYEIPVTEAEELLKLCEGIVIAKTRWRVPYGSHLWEVDVFEGENQGLTVAEIELESEDELFEKPSWVGGEVSDDPRYFNGALSRHPFTQW